MSDTHEEREFEKMSVEEMLVCYEVNGRGRDFFRSKGWLHKTSSEIGTEKWFQPNLHHYLRKQWRRMWIKNHPDKGGSGCRITLGKIDWIWKQFLHPRYATEEEVVDLTNGSGSEDDNSDSNVQDDAVSENSTAGDGVDSENDNNSIDDEDIHEMATKRARITGIGILGRDSSPHTTNSSLATKPLSLPSPSSDMPDVKGIVVYTGFWYQGEVESIWHNEDKKGGREYLHRVIYEDGDKEDLTYEQLMLLPCANSVKGRKAKSSYDSLGNKGYKIWKMFIEKGVVTDKIMGPEGGENKFCTFFTVRDISQSMSILPLCSGNQKSFFLKYSIPSMWV